MPAALWETREQMEVLAECLVHAATGEVIRAGMHT